MKYRFEATQTIHKYFEVEADSEETAFDKAEEMLNEGEIHFDDEPFLKMKCELKMPKS